MVATIGQNSDLSRENESGRTPTLLHVGILRSCRAMPSAVLSWTIDAPEEHHVFTPSSGT